MIKLNVALLAAAALSMDVVRAETSNSGAVIIYVVIGVVVLLVLAGAIFVCMRSRSRDKNSTFQDHNPGPYDDSSLGQPPRPTVGRPPHAAPQNTTSSSSTYHGYTSPALRPDRDRAVVPNGMNASAGNSYAYADPQRPVRPSQPPRDPRTVANPNPNAPPPHVAVPRPHRPTPTGRPVPAPPNQRPQRVNETAARVLAEFQADPALSRLKIPYAALYFTRVLSKGAFGEVWLAQLENRQVAVKRILNEKKNDEKEIECFAAEIKLMASFYHPKIVEFVGVSWSTLQDLCAVTEYMAKGDLYGFLKRKNGQLNWRDHKIYLAEDVADALGYLHSLSPKVIHRDLKSKNILLDDAFRAKLSDFGISRERSLEETMTAGVGTIYWTAPEVLMGKKYTEKADIYSFGIVMSELDTHDVPYSDMRDEAGKKLQGMKIVQQVIKKQLRPTFSSSCPTIVRDLAARCLNAEPDVRPDALELLNLIQRIQQQL